MTRRAAWPLVLGALALLGCDKKTGLGAGTATGGNPGPGGTGGTGTGGPGSGGAAATSDAALLADSAVVGDAATSLRADAVMAVEVRGTGGGTGGASVSGGAGGKVGTGGAGGLAGSAGSGGWDRGGAGGAIIIKLDGAILPDAPLGAGGATTDGGNASTGSCPPAPTQGFHTIHFRYLWAGQKTFTYFPKLESIPASIQLELGTEKVTCPREMDRPWFSCSVPDSAFRVGATWRAVDPAHAVVWATAVNVFPSTPREYWVRWYYGRPDVARTTEPGTFQFLDYNPDTSNGDWAATGNWSYGACVPSVPSNPAKVGFEQGWFPYKSTQYLYPYGGSLAYLFPDLTSAQDVFDAFVFERYQLWKQNYIRYDAEACGSGTARVHTDPPATVSEGQGYGIAMAAAIGDKELFDKLWKFTRSYLSQGASRYCGGLMGWMWQGNADCRPLDMPCEPGLQSCGGNADSAFDGDVDIGIGLVFAAMQWPEYKQAASDWLVKMECEVNTAYDGKWNYPSVGDSWDKDCASYPDKPCTYVKGTRGNVRLDYYPPGYLRVFGDFLATQLGGSAQASNGQSHRDFWYKTAETVYEMIEACYDQKGVHPALVGVAGTVDAPCSTPTGGYYEELRALWRVGVDAAWFGNDTALPENAANSSSHYSGKSRVQAKLDNAQAFFNDFHKLNPPEPNANRFSSLCKSLDASGSVANCDPTKGHDGYTVNMAMCSYVSVFNAAGATTSDIRREAIEEAITTTVENTKYLEESLGVYSLLFMTGNFPNPMTVPAR